MYLHKVNSGNTRTVHEICSKMPIKTPMSGVNDIVSVPLLLTLNIFIPFPNASIVDFEHVNVS